jgi:hypothetical protein
MRVVPAQNPTGKGEQRLSLECLKFQGEAALACSDIPGLQKIVLREVHLFRRDLRHQPVARIAQDIFRAYRSEDLHALFPLDCTITRAVFDFYFADSTIPRSVATEPPSNPEPERPSDAEAIQRWAALRGFIVQCAPRDNPDEQAMAIP